MSKLFVMMGTPGSGKSTFIRNKMPKNAVCVSRDAVRFSMVKEDEEYFSKENEVFKEFINQIISNLKNGVDVYADATHLSRGSRNKLLRCINPHDYDEVNAIWIKVPVDVALEQNEYRNGTRSYVPKSVIRRMSCQMEAPDFDEGFSTIYIVEPNKPIQIRKEM